VVAGSAVMMATAAVEAVTEVTATAGEVYPDPQAIERVIRR